MTKIAKSFPVVLMAATLLASASGCNSSDAKVSAGPLTPAQVTASGGNSNNGGGNSGSGNIPGTDFIAPPKVYVAACVPNLATPTSQQDSVSTYLNGVYQFTFVTRTFPTADCSGTPDFTVTIVANVEGSVVLDTAGNEANFKRVSTQFEFDNPLFVAAFNRGQFCGTTTWVVGQPQDVSGVSCFGQDQLAIGAVQAGRFSDSGSTFQYALAPDATPDVLPAKVGPQVYVLQK